jgi:hypothetical protein
MRGGIIAALEGQFEAVDQARSLARQLWEQESSSGRGTENRT